MVSNYVNNDGFYIPIVREYIQTVYIHCVILLLSFFAGIYGIAPYLSFSNGLIILIFIIELILIVHLAMTTNGERYGWRTFEAGVLTSMMGVTLYPMILFANIVDVEIIPTALCMSIGIFMTFSGLVHYYPSPKYIYIGGPLISMLNTLCILMLISLFTGWQIVYRVDMYVGTLVFIGLIMYDTEMMILRGLDATTHDYVMDSLMLVLDFINIFVRIVKILLKHTKKDN